MSDHFKDIIEDYYEDEEDDDSSQWIDFIQDVKPLKNTDIVVTDITEKKTKVRVQKRGLVLESTRRDLHVRHYGNRELKKAKPQFHLDLHGCTKEQAQLALIRLIDRFPFGGWILVITGKGGMSSDGSYKSVIRSMLIDFMHSHPHLIIGYGHPEQGGAGAFLIHLRKRIS